ncbi:MAG: HAMP domain-containing histidine kinase [Acidobacteriota bacterium]|nr:HAMP domain-containing histidine kinase [Acidobacteriota bacterium]
MTDKSSEQFTGIALRCDKQGFVLDVITTGENLVAEARRPSAGESFMNLLDSASQPKAEVFFAELRERKTAFGWEMNVVCENDEIETLHFAGAAAGNGDDDGASDNGGGEEPFLIVGAKSRSEILDFYNGLVYPDGEQRSSAASRRSIKNLSRQLSADSDRDRHYYEQLSRVNNELVTLHRELAKKNIELKRLNDEKNQFLGMAAHDLRNPLQVVLGYSQLLLKGATGDLNEAQTRYIEKIFSSSEFMLTLVNDFLDYSKIEAGLLDLKLAPADLAPLIHRIVGQVRVQAEKKQLWIITNLASDLPEMSLDESKIEQALVNLIGNALKFSPAGSAIEIEAFRRGEEEVVLSVGDHGAGIAPEEAETLFKPFSKGRSKPTGGEKGSGLGLAIVKKIVEAHGGKITFETTPGKGTTFYISLPVGQRKTELKK